MKTALYIALLSLGAASLSACGSESSNRRGDTPGGQRNDAPATVPGGGGGSGGSETPQNGGNGGGSGNTGSSSEASDGPIVLGFFGGFTSCASDGETPDPKEQNLAEAFDEALAAAAGASEKDPVTIRSCFTSDPSQVHIVTSVDPDKVKSVSLSNLAKEIDAFLTSKAPGGKLRLVGHSYGGWTVLSLARTLDPKINVDALVTIDPISVRDCNVPSFFAGGAGCRRAPTDFGDDGVAAIKKRVGNWVNFYQTSDTALYSGAMNGAENIRREYPRGTLGPHNAFLEDTVVIKKIAEVAAGKKP